MPHHFDYSRVREMRSRYVPYKEVERIVDPGNGDIILDIGSGDGFYSINYAKKAAGGKVYAVEMNEEANNFLRERISEERIGNIEIVQRNVCSGMGIKNFNKVFFSTSFHDIKCRDDLIGQLVGNSGENLEITLIEFRKGSDIGPPGNIKLSEDELRNIFEGHGFIFVKSVVLEQHYIHKYAIRKK